MRDLQISSDICSVGRIAQSVEQRIENPRVAGSIPAPATNTAMSLKSQLYLI